MNAAAKIHPLTGRLKAGLFVQDGGASDTSAKHLKYRADIDGLRSLAILPVVLNHLGVRGFWGGYVGVDIFFVISGFLITSNIYLDSTSGTYTIKDFYKRRILRIFPALFLLFAVCTLIACRVMLPTELIRYARSLIGATFFGSNVLFYAEAGYFEPAARLKPLLHTWSLAIEEQFYIVWPLVVAPVARRWPARLPWFALAVIVLSLGLSIWLVDNDPSAAYYLLPSRAWELSIGALLAVLPKFRLQAWLNQALASAALVAIIFAVRRFNETTPFPGLCALLPCLGAATLIMTGAGRSWVARMLGWRPVVFVGQISYSLYLWHWPVIVFGSIGLFLAPSPLVMAGEFAAALALATVSTFWIERPFRLHARRWPVNGVLLAGVAAMAATALVAAGLLLSAGLPQRFTPAQRQVAAYEALDGDALYRRGTCFAVGPRMRFDARACLAHARPLPSLLLLGDSHAAHFWPGLARYQARFDVMQATHTGCKPVLYPPGGDACRAFMRAMLTHWLRSNRPDVTLLAARWRVEDLPLLAQTLSDPLVRASHPVLVGPVPQYTSGLPRLLVFGEIKGNPNLAFASRDPQVELADRAMAGLAARMHVPYVSMLDQLCDTSQCIEWARPGIPLQFDYGHFTREGSIRAADVLMNRLSKIGNRSLLQRAS